MAKVLHIATLFPFLKDEEAHFGHILRALLFLSNLDVSSGAEQRESRFRCLQLLEEKTGQRFSAGTIQDWYSQDNRSIKLPVLEALAEMFGLPKVAQAEFVQLNQGLITHAPHLVDIVNDRWWQYCREQGISTPDNPYVPEFLRVPPQQGSISDYDEAFSLDEEKPLGFHTILRDLMLIAGTDDNTLAREIRKAKGYVIGENIIRTNRTSSISYPGPEFAEGASIVLLPEGGLRAQFMALAEAQRTRDPAYYDEEGQLRDETAWDLLDYIEANWEKRFQDPAAPPMRNAQAVLARKNAASQDQTP